MEAVRQQGRYENQRLRHALESLASAIVQQVQLTKGHAYPVMPKVLKK